MKGPAKRDRSPFAGLARKLHLFNVSLLAASDSQSSPFGCVVNRGLVARSPDNGFVYLTGN